MKILLVDDEQSFLTVMSELLRRNGHQVIVAEDGKQAREALEMEPVDLIISDVFMPTLDGVRFHSYVRDFTDAHEVPFIFMSGYVDEKTKSLINDSRIDFFLSKTTPGDKIISFIEQLRTSQKRTSA